MEPNTQNQTNPVVSGDHKKVGPIIAGSIIVLIVIIAAIYIFASQTGQSGQPTNPESSTNPAAAVESVKPITNTSDDTSSLQNDLNQSTSGLDNQNI